MKYYLYRKQSGQGCGYSIGCGETLNSLRGKTKEEAIKEAIGIPDNWKDQITDKDGNIDEDELHDYLCDTGLRHLDQGEFRLDQCLILEINEEIDIFPLLKARQAEVTKILDELRTSNSLEMEKAEYERLKKKFKGK